MFSNNARIGYICLHLTLSYEFLIIGDIDFFGGIRAILLNIIEDLLHEKAGTTIGNTLCDILHNATVSGLNGMLKNLIDEIIEPYLLNSDDLFSNINPLAGEMSWDSLYEGKDYPKVMDFTESDIFKVVNATNELFSTKVYDPDGPNELDLGLNVMLRSVSFVYISHKFLFLFAKFLNIELFPLGY